MPITYNTQTRRFEKDGEEITPAVLYTLIEKLTERTRRDARRISKQYDDGKITLDQWHEQMAELLVSAHIVAATVGRGGSDRMTVDDWQRIDDKITWQTGYLDKFKKAIQAGGVGIAAGQIASRAATYASAPFISYSNAYQEAQTEAVANLATGQDEKPLMARLIQNSKEGCEECTADSNEGWMPVEDMGEIGSRECGDFCLCEIEFSDEGQTE